MRKFKFSASKGFATVASTVILSAASIAGLYMIKTINKQEAVRSLNHTAFITANRLAKVQLSIDTYLRTHPNSNISSCDDLVNAGLISKNDCKDNFGNKLAINNNQVELQNPYIPPNSMLGNNASIMYQQLVYNYQQKIQQQYGIGGNGDDSNSDDSNDDKFSKMPSFKRLSKAPRVLW